MGVPSIAERQKRFEKVLEAAGFRVTRQRRAILAYLASTESHPSARQVFQEARKACPELSLATVYNTLEVLARIGLIKVLDFQVMDNRHETNLPPHINLICTSCGRIEDFKGGVTILVHEVRKEFGFEVKDFRMEYYGVCAECRARGHKGS